MMHDRNEYIKVMEQIAEKVNQNPDMPVIVTPSFLSEVLEMLKDQEKAIINLLDERTQCVEWYEGYHHLYENQKSTKIVNNGVMTIDIGGNTQ